MDEEQALASPLAGNLRGIRRSVSSSIFAGRPVAPAPKPDPETTSLLSQNSLALSNVSEQLNTINRSISVLTNSLATIQQNLALSDQLERQREAAKQKKHAMLRKSQKNKRCMFSKEQKQKLTRGMLGKHRHVR